METNIKQLHDSLAHFLTTEILNVTFTKANGEERTMKCTLNPALIEDTYEKKTDRVKKQNDDVMSVWDVEKKAWRSFRLDSVIKYSFDFYSF